MKLTALAMTTFLMSFGACANTLSEDELSSNVNKVCAIRDTLGDHYPLGNKGTTSPGYVANKGVLQSGIDYFKNHNTAVSDIDCSDAVTKQYKSNLEKYRSIN